MHHGRKRVVIENLQPQVESGHYPIKRVVGEIVCVTADIFADGHDEISARILFKGPENNDWQEVGMLHAGNDIWRGKFSVKQVGLYYYTVEAWIDYFGTWQADLEKRSKAGQNLTVQFLEGAQYIEAVKQNAVPGDTPFFDKYIKLLKSPGKESEKYSIAVSEEITRLMGKYPNRHLSVRYDKEFPVDVERDKALFSSWYERFPRSCSGKPGAHGTFEDCIRILPEVAGMGFDVWYLPPIHPIGKVKRKGKNNAPIAQPRDVGSPWAIGSDEGGHKSIHPKLGTMKDFKKFITEAKSFGIEIALDLAFQCAPDHPYVKDHPEWFRWKPDGTIHHAENPPKKYEDIIPFNFECEDWQKLWDELKSVVLYWAEKSIRVFRVDNPHTKPFRFWEWLIKECKTEYPDLLFLSEAFTRPKVMYRLAKVGLAQSYTYFTWRNTKPEIIEYITHLLNTEVREFFRPNFWPNTPDILPEHLQYGGKPAFITRLMLAATLSASYGIYGPPFELCVSEAIPGKEEYKDSEKYEIKHWDWDRQGNLKDIISKLNAIRRENPALKTTWNLKFHEVDNEYIIFYSKANEDLSNIILVFVNLDPAYTQSGWVKVPIHEYHIPTDQPYLVHELFSDNKFIWHGERNYVQLDPNVMPVQIFRVRKRLKRESDFDYYF